MTIDLSFVTGPGPEGLAASVIAGAPAQQGRITGLTGITPAMVGEGILLLNLSNPTNVNIGFRQIVTRVSATTVDVADPTSSMSIPDAGPFAWVVLDGPNTWTLQPSNDDTKDADNFQFVLLASASITAGAVNLFPLIKGTFEALIQLGFVFPFFIRKSLAQADFRGCIVPLDPTKGATIVAGTKAGGAMDFMDNATETTPVDRLGNTIADIVCPALLPSLFTFYNLPGGIGNSINLEGLTLKTNKSVTNPVADYWFAFGNPWPNFGCQFLVQKKGLVGWHKPGVVASISAPNGGGDQTVVMAGVRGIFNEQMEDDSWLFTNYDSPNPQNNDQFVIKTFVNAHTITIHNPGGVANASPNNRFGIFQPTNLPGTGTGIMGRFDFRATGCTFQGSLGDPVAAYGGTPVSNVDTAVQLDDQTLVIAEGTDTPPFNSQVNAGLFSSSTDSFPTIDRSFAIINGRHFWWVENHVSINGNLAIEKNTFSKIGLIFEIAGFWQTNGGMSWLKPPRNALRPSLKFLDNTSIDCGLTAEGGSGPAGGFWASNQGDTNFSNNKMTEPLGGTKDPFNFLGGFQVSDGSAIFPDPTTLSMYCFPEGATQENLVDEGMAATIPPDVTIEMLSNRTDLGGVGAFQPAFFGLRFAGAVSSTGDPLGFWGSALLGQNLIKGPIIEPLHIQGGGNIEVLENSIAGLSAFPQLRLDNATNIQLINNKFSAGGVNILLSPETWNVVVANSSNGAPTVQNMGCVNQIGTVRIDPGPVPTTRSRKTRVGVI
jgi:hypothetical protein